MGNVETSLAMPEGGHHEWEKAKHGTVLCEGLEYAVVPEGRLSAESSGPGPLRRAKSGKENTFVCSFCQRVFRKSYNLLIHERSHKDQAKVHLNVLRAHCAQWPISATGSIELKTNIEIATIHLNNLVVKQGV